MCDCNGRFYEFSAAPLNSSSSASALAPSRARPRGRRHKRLTSQHGGLWYHLWVGRRRGWARSERRALAQILSGTRGDAWGRAHHSVSGVACSWLPPVALLFCLSSSVACLADASMLADANTQQPAVGQVSLVSFGSTRTSANTSVTQSPPHAHRFVSNR